MIMQDHYITIFALHVNISINSELMIRIKIYLFLNNNKKIRVEEGDENVSDGDYD